ncbi:MAG: helix-turn-helix domain-containing protein [Patescibacteria group bacterium]|nr:helix-turn-helix domain-containing protein [Patescibacteria group bacterium]
MTEPTTTQLRENENHATFALPSDLITAAEVATRLGVAKSAVYEWIARRDIAYHRVGRLIRIRETDVAAFLNRNRVEYNPRRRHVRYPEA